MQFDLKKYRKKARVVLMSSKHQLNYIPVFPPPNMSANYTIQTTTKKISHQPSWRIAALMVKFSSHNAPICHLLKRPRPLCATLSALLLILGRSTTPGAQVYGWWGGGAEGVCSTQDYIAAAHPFQIHKAA